VRVIAVSALLISISFTAYAQQDPEAKLFQELETLDWRSAPKIPTIGGEAQISLNSNIRFLDSANTNRFVQLQGNPPVNNAYSIAPKSLS
jgi:hypothetical protein